MARIHRLFFLMIVITFTACVASAQVTTGTPPFGSFGGGPDIINLANLNSHITIPVIHKPGRGGFNFTYDLTYDSSVWYSTGTTWQYVTNWGWKGQTEAAIGYITYSYSMRRCLVDPGPPRQYNIEYDYQNFVYHDSFGVPHWFPIRLGDGGCLIDVPSQTATASDGSGYTMTASIGSEPSADATVTSAAGKVIGAPMQTPTGAGVATDRNGNQISASTGGVFTDTLGTTALTVTGGAPNPLVFTYAPPAGGSVSYTMKYSPQTVQTAFGCSGISEYGPTSISLVSEIDLPDGSKYTFAYEQTPGVPANVTGRLKSVTLPTGGMISYTYSGGNNGVVCADGSAATLTRTTPDGTWTYAHSESGTAWTTLITDPQGNQTNMNFQGIYETERDSYQGSTSGTLLATTNTCYNGSASPCNSTAIALPITQRQVITTLPVPGSSTVQSKSGATFNGFGVPTEIDSYAFGSGAPPTTPTRKTLITYASLGNITAFRQTVTVKDGNNNVLAQTNYNYDQTTPINPPTGTPPQWTSVSGSRGNLTSVQRCTNLSSCSAYLQTTMTYDTAGQLQTVKDPLNNQTSFGYADSFLDDDGSNPPSHTHSTSTPTDAFATTVTPPLNGALAFKYYYSGQLALSTDQNGNNSFSHFDSLGRLTSSYGPSLGANRPWLLNVYASSDTQADSYLNINDTSTTATASCSVCRHDQILLDGLGRATTQELVSDPEGATFATTSYDPLGRVKNVSHPYRSTSDTTYGLETPSYDALGRTIKVTHQDNTYSQAFFAAAVSGTGVNTTQLCSPSTYGLAYPTLFIDEAGKKREVWADGLGRTIEADEPDSNGNLTSATCYTYDPQGNLLQIIHGTQTRTYAYDALSRVSSVTIPELANSSGTNCAVTYSYDSNSNLQTQTAPAPNQSTCTSTVTTTFFYDALNRLAGKTYSDSTPSVNFFYDQTAYNGLTITNGKGRRTGMSDASGATAWSYDAAGRILTEKRTILGVTKTISYSYNLDGSVATATYPSNNVITYTVSNAQRLTAANDVANSVQFATAASYAAPGGLQGMISGKINGGFGGITESHTYNSSLEYTGTQATSTAGTALNLALNYNLPGGDNGTVTGITNNADPGRTQSFSYDPLNRISSATTQATSGVGCWGQSFSPDALANLNTISSAQCSSGTLSVTVDNNNHINSSTTFAYDAAGNMTQDGSGTGYSYTFDDENHLTLASGFSGGPYCYVYDGNGLRVAKKSGATTCSSGTVTKLYWRTVSGDALAETDGSGSTTNSAYAEYVFFGGRRIASRNGTSSVFYFFADQLGSTRTITDANGNLCYDADFTPYGQEISHTERLQTTACPSNYKFTGYERDSETGLDYAFARYYSSRLGRFLSTDPLGGSIGDLQSHNAYAYTANNPLNLTDPAGLRPGCDRGDATCNAEMHDVSNWFSVCHAIGPTCLFSFFGLDEFDLLIAAFTPTGIRDDPGCPAGDCSDPYIYGNIGALLLLGGPGGGGGNTSARAGTSPFSFQDRLSLCALSFFDVGLRTFVPAAPGQNGNFVGVKQGGGLFNVETDVSSYTKMDLARKTYDFGQILNGQGVEGATPKSNPYKNYVASDLSPEAFLGTQIHELGHSLGRIAWGYSNDDLAEFFSDCVFGVKGFNPNKR